MDAELEDFLFLDVGAEVDVNPDDVGVVRPKKKKTLLKKADKKVLIDKLRARIDSQETIPFIIKTVDGESHVHVFKDRETLWNLLQQQQSLLSTVFKGLVEIFLHIFKSCEKGKDKYSKFQVEWHLHCSMLLQSQIDDTGIKEMSQIHQRWLGFCEGSGFAKKVYDPVMISICAAVYDYLMQQVLEQQKGCSSEPIPMHIEQDTDDVYFRFGGATLASMLHLRYDSIRSAPNSKKDSITAEIQVLKNIQCIDKSHVPEYLQYRDRGYMYFPKMCFIPYFKAVDQCVLKLTNEEEFKKHGSKLVEVVTQQVHSNQELQEKFRSELDINHCEESVKKVYLEMTRKLCNTRIQEFLDVHRQRAAKIEGSATIAGQNLRDTLLTYHVNPKCNELQKYTQ